jgi:hypothetical protein
LTDAVVSLGEASEGDAQADGEGGGHVHLEGERGLMCLMWCSEWDGISNGWERSQMGYRE